MLIASANIDMLPMRYSLVALLLAAIVSPGQTERRRPSSKSEDFIFDVQPRVIAPGEAAILRWSIKGATKVIIEEMPDSKRDLRKLGTFDSTGRLEVYPKEATTYVVSCEGSTTYSCASVTVRVRVTPRVSPRSTSRPPNYDGKGQWRDFALRQSEVKADRSLSWRFPQAKIEVRASFLETLMLESNFHSAARLIRNGKPSALKRD
jgi:hypothetical protein